MLVIVSGAEDVELRYGGEVVKVTVRNGNSVWKVTTSTTLASHLMWAGIAYSVVGTDRIPMAATFSEPNQNDPGANPSYCSMGTGSLSLKYSGQGMTLTTYTL
jgi:hypothetical protein